MERNHNPQVVTIAVEMYQELLAMANTSPRYTTKRIARHARKFNPHLQPEHQVRVIHHERHRNEMIRTARAFKEAHCGKEIFIKVQMGRWEEEGAPVYLPVKVMRVNSKDRRLVDILRYEDEHKTKYKIYDTVSPEGFIFELPAGYIKGYGPYREYFVKQGASHDIEADEKRKDAEYEANRANREGELVTLSCVKTWRRTNET